jgi:crotonobetainyl-CoA:carnitine CoA-transferase CaiB-like acyl-CoA transferase
LGEHTEEILQERLQMSNAEMRALRDKGVIWSSAWFEVLS